MSLDGSTYTFVPYTINGINTVASPTDIANCVKYNGNTSNTDLGTFDLTTSGTLSAQTLAIPANPSNDESWITYTVSTMGNLSTVGGLITTDLTNGRSMYFTGGVLGAPNFQFATLGNDNKVVCTNDYGVMSTTINAGQLSYITGLTSQAGGVGQTNTWTGSNTFDTLTNVASLRITSSVVNADYTLSVNPYDQLEFTNLSNGSIFKTNGADLFVSGNITCATLGANNVEASGSFYLAKGTTAEWRTTLGMSDEYEILDNAGVRRLRLSKTSGLTVSTMNITQVPSATPSLALGVNGGGQVVSFAVPVATNILPLANTFTNTNDFLSTFTTGVGYTTNINGALTTSLSNFAFTSASFTTAGITGAYTPPLGTITNPSGSTYQITQTASGRSIMAISGFTPAVGITYVFEFNINCTVGTATISVEQDNILVSPALYQLSTGFNRVVGSFTYNGTANTVVFKIYTGVASWNAQWDSFTLSTYSVGLNANMNCQTVNNRITQRYNALATDVSTLVNRATMDSAISAATPPNLLPLNNIWTGTNTYNNGVQIAAGSLGVATGNIVKQSATATSFIQITGGNATNSPFMEFYFNGTRRSYIGNANATDMFIAAENGAQLSFDVAGARALSINTNRDLIMNIQKAFYMYYISGTNHAAFNTSAGGDLSIYTGTSGVGSRFTVKADGTTTHTSGDNSYMRYGPNGTWGAYLTVGATPDRSGASNAQVISTNGNLHLDAGNSNAIYYGYYPNSRGTPNSHEFYGAVNLYSGTYVFNALAYNTYIYAHSVVLEGAVLRRSQCLMRQVYNVAYISWGGGVNMTYAFYKYSQVCPVRISGKYSGYCTFVGMPTMTMRIYSQNSGAYRYYAFPTWQNITYAQTTYPIDIILDHTLLPETGWFDIYIYNSYGMSTDINNQLWVNVELLPVNSF